MFFTVKRRLINLMLTYHFVVLKAIESHVQLIVHFGQVTRTLKPAFILFAIVWPALVHLTLGLFYFTSYKFTLVLFMRID